MENGVRRGETHHSDEVTSEAIYTVGRETDTDKRMSETLCCCLAELAASRSPARLGPVSPLLGAGTVRPRLVGLC